MKILITIDETKIRDENLVINGIYNAIELIVGYNNFMLERLNNEGD